VALLKKMLTSGGVARAEGESRVMTFLFCDINGFTTFSENMLPTKLVQYLSEYFDVMTKVILQHGGVVDKYIGDGIMAFWGAPQDDSEHALHACQCALDMLKVLPSINAKWKETGGADCSIRIGINTGEAVVGNIGSSEHLNYTVIGDSVNVASRLEELNKFYDSVIIISHTTYALAHEYFNLRFLDRIAVRGKKQDFNIYEIIAPSFKLNENLEQYCSDFKQAFAFYVNGAWEQAIAVFEQLVKHYPEDKLAMIYLERCRNFKDQPPSEWQGIWRMQ